jgi:cytochrome c oxidase assembly factor CtaG
MTTLVRIGVEMLLLGVAPAVVVALGRGRWRRGGLLTHPVVGMFAFNATLIAVQAPAMVLAMASSALVGAAAQCAFLLAAILFWWPILRPQAAGGLSPMSKIGYLLIAGVPPTIPGLVLAISPHLLYPRSAGAFGLTPLEDQQLAGLLLFGTAKLILLTVTFVILWRLLDAQRDAPDGGWDQPGIVVTPPPAPAWFARLEEELPPEPSVERPAVLAGARRTQRENDLHAVLHATLEPCPGDR